MKKPFELELSEYANWPLSIKIITIVTVCLLCLFAAYFLIISDKLTQQKVLKKQIAKLEAQKITTPYKETSPKEIEISFNKTSTRAAIQKLAALGNISVIISNSVQGEINMHLKNLPPRKALDLLLKSQSLAQQKMGDVIYIAPISEIAHQEKQTNEEQKPFHMALLRMNYADAETIAKTLKNKDNSLLSEKATVMTDKRTNSLLIKDTPRQIKELRQVIEQLDIPTPQVSIEARIVSIDNDYEKELGVKFGISNRQNISGSLTGANEIASGKAFSEIPIKDRLNVDLPVLNKNTGSIGLALFKLQKGTLLDLELSALESEGHAEIISAPRLVTINQRPATIEAGEEIPYQESVAQGVTATSFKKAVLRLEVTPQITADRKIILHLKANQDKRSSKEINGVPSVDTRQIDTQVRIEDNQTVVLGGIYEHTKTKGIERIPFFGQLPIVGVLFRNKKIINNRRELLIFVTPKIIPLS